MKKVISLLLIAVLMFSLASCGLFETEKVFNIDGLSITLTNGFTENDAMLEELQEAYKELAENYDNDQSPHYEAVYYLENANIGISFLRCEPKTPTDLNLMKDLLRDGYLQRGYKTSDSKKEGDFRYFDVEIGDGAIMVACYESKGDRSGVNDVYWIVQFACDSRYYSSYADTFLNWAKSVTVE